MAATGGLGQLWMFPWAGYDVAVCPGVQLGGLAPPRCACTFGLGLFGVVTGFLEALFPKRKAVG